MRVLLDENMPLDFGELLSGHEVCHVELLGHKGIRNGALLSLARENFDVLVSLDKGLLYQHNHLGHRLIVIVLRVQDSKPVTVRSCSSALVKALGQSSPGELVEVRGDDDE